MRELRHTIGYWEPSVLFLHLELVRKSRGVWILRVVHLCAFLVGRLYSLFDILWIGLGGIRHIWLPLATCSGC